MTTSATGPEYGGAGGWVSPLQSNCLLSLWMLSGRGESREARAHPHPKSGGGGAQGASGLPSSSCCPHPPPRAPKPWWVLAGPSSYTGTARLRRPRLQRSNFPKGLRLISSHTGAERERRVGAGAGSIGRGTGWRPSLPAQQAGRQAGGLDSLGALKVSGQAG